VKTEALQAWLDDEGAGALVEDVPLKTAGAADAALVRTASGVRLAFWEGEARLLLALRDASPLRYVEKVIGGELVVGHRVLQVPAGRGEDTRRLLGLARVAPDGTAPREDADGGRYVQRATDTAALFLGDQLDDDELVLAWIETATEVDVDSTVLKRRVPWRFLLTTRRQALVAITAVGDARVLELPGEEIDVERSVGRDTLRAGGHSWQSPLLLEDLWVELAPLPALDEHARALAVARLSWANRAGKERDPAAMARLLGWLADRKDPDATLLLAALADELPLDAPGDETRESALDEIRARETGSGALVRLWKGFGLDRSFALDLMEALGRRGEDGKRFAVELHAALRDELLDEAVDGFESATIDIAWAEHLLEVGQAEDAQIALESRLLALPDEELLDLLPPRDADLTEGSGGQRFRIELLELLARARGERERLDVATVRSLAQLQPLVPSRMRELLELADGEVKASARHALSVLEPGGLAPLDDSAPNSPDGPVHAIGKKLLEGRLRHPASREGHALEKLQTFLATVEVPDHAALRDYCERLGESEVAARDAVADACLALGVRGLGAFVSRGDKAVGIRAYEGSPSFLVIGGRHLEAGSDFFLHPWELRFAVAAEIAHLRFGHSRVTASDVWAGALEKGKVGVDLVVGMIPVLKGVEVIDRIGQVLDKYAKGPLGRMMKGLDLAERTVTKTRKGKKKKGRPREKLVADTNDRLIAAHRVMQLTADRAGLLLAADLGAALRAIFRSSHTYLAELAVAERHGIAKALGQRDDEGEIVFQDLAVRASSLISFYLSDDYRALRAALTED
jgi:hypothetical protein